MGGLDPVRSEFDAWQHRVDRSLSPVVELDGARNLTGRSAGATSRLRKRWLWRLGVLAFMVLVAGAVSVALIVRGLSSPPVGDLPTDPDAVIVFGGEDRRTQLALERMAVGLAPTLVVSHGTDDNFARDLCGQQRPFEVMCVEPDVSSTRGEAQMFGELAARFGWERLVAVTGDYHVQRARVYLDRCFDGEFGFIAVDWPYYNARILRHEVLGYLQARLFSRGC